VASGGAHRIALVFPSRVWEPAVRRIAFLRGEGRFPTFWFDADRPVVTAWVGGPEAWRLSSLPERERVTVAVGDLATALNLPGLDRRLVGWHTHDWLADPLARGAYSFTTVGGADRRMALREPRGRLVLAGEYVPGPGVSSTVEAALASGRAAGVLAAAGRS
jgi:monoamine oxidase